MITQWQPNMHLAEKLSQAISKLEVNNVFLSKAEVSISKHPGVIKPDNTAVDFSEGTSWNISKNGDLLLCSVQRTLRGLSEEGEGVDPKEVLHFDVTFIVQYIVNDPERTIDKHTFEVFSKTNAVYNSYPYFREYIHSTCARMGIAPIILSFMKPLTMKQIVEMFPEPIPTNTEKVEG